MLLRFIDQLLETTPVVTVQQPRRQSMRARGTRAINSRPGKRRQRGRGQPQRRRAPGQRRSPRQPGACRRSRTLVAYHGTPSEANAASIIKDGFMVGSGNALGDGIYLATDSNTAKGYAGSSGVYLKCRVALGKSCRWDAAMQARYAAWCRQRGVAQDNSAITAFLIRECGFNTVVSGNVLVVLAPQYANPSAWKRKHQQIRILSVHRADNDACIRV